MAHQPVLHMAFSPRGLQLAERPPGAPGTGAVQKPVRLLPLTYITQTLLPHVVLAVQDAAPPGGWQ